MVEAAVAMLVAMREATLDPMRSSSPEAEAAATATRAPRRSFKSRIFFAGMALFLLKPTV